jgi:hypothetical protein
MKEIYKLKVKKFTNEQGIPVVQRYVLGTTGDVDGEILTPVKMTVRKDKVVIRFAELGIIQEFAMSADVEVFKRDKVKEDENTRTDS